MQKFSKSIAVRGMQIRTIGNSICSMSKWNMTMIYQKGKENSCQLCQNVKHANNVVCRKIVSAEAVLTKSASCSTHLCQKIAVHITLGRRSKDVNAWVAKERLTDKLQNQGKASRKVDKGSVASPRQWTSPHLPCCRGHYPRVWLRTPPTFTLLSRSDTIRFPSVQTFKRLTSWTGFWGRWSRYYGRQWVDWRAGSKYLPWRCQKVGAEMGKLCCSPGKICGKTLKRFWC